MAAAPALADQSTKRRLSSTTAPSFTKHCIAMGLRASRPGQEAVVRASPQDATLAVIMPTGGRQVAVLPIPAVLDARTAVVISPLIALMQDRSRTPPDGHFRRLLERRHSP